MLKKLFVFCLLFLFLLPLSVDAYWVSLNKDIPDYTPPKVSLLEDDNSSSTIRIDLAGFEIKEFNADGKTYQSIDLLTDIFTTKEGYPEIPYITKILAIPDQAGISLEVLETSEIQSFNGFHLPPARYSWAEGAPEPAYIENKNIYQMKEIYPKEHIKADPPVIFRDFRISRVSIYPIQYIPNKGEIQIVSSITIRVNYGGGEVINPKTTPQRAIAPSFAPIYKSFIFNYESILNRKYQSKETGYDVMLCIIPDEFVDTFEEYAEWKHKSGTYVHITKFSDIGANSSDPNIIKDHITDAYNNWEHPPTYVLLVGDDGICPLKSITEDGYTFATEDYFVTVEGNDYFPEMMIGRFTNQNDYTLEVMINKFINYERNPYMDNTDWFKRGTCCSNNLYESQVEIKHFTANVMLEDGGFTSVDTLMSDYNPYSKGCSMNLSDVTNTINEGRTILNYRGEGWSYGWAANCYWFDTGDVASQINNGEMLTFVTSIGCGVAMFNEGGGNCFGEQWLELGSLTAPRGACAFVGPTSNTHTTYNNKLDKGIYVGMFREGMDTPGQALLRGKLYMYNVYGDVYWVGYHYKMYCILGDPSIHIWKDIPQEISVDYSSNAFIGLNQFQVNVTTLAKEPVENAQVCIASDEIYSVGFTDATGKAIVTIIPTTTDTLDITVRGGNVIAYENTISVIEQAEYVSYDGEPTIEDLDGNTNGLVNPNENCQITFTLKNWGTETANNVQATLTVSDTTYVQILTTSSIDYGNLESNATNTVSSFQFYIKENCPTDYIIPLNLHITSTNKGTWDYIINVEIKGCKLEYESLSVNDANSSQRNYRMDPGETVKLYITIANIGEDIASDVKGILRTNDSYITIIDSISSFGTLGIDSTATNENDYFIINIEPNCSIQYYVDYSLELYTTNTNYSYSLIIDTLSISVGVPMANEPSGPDAYGYYAYDSEDTFYEQVPVYNWMNIDRFGTEIIMPDNLYDYTETVGLPFTFKYYGIDYNEIRISTDGWIAFGSGNQIAFENDSLPYVDDVNCMVAAFWDNLFDIWDENATLKYIYDNIEKYFVIQWSNVGHFENWGPEETFQIILLDPNYYPTDTGDGEIIFQYNTLSNIWNNTIGIENHNQDIGLQYVCNDNYLSTASILKDGLAIKFTTQIPSENIDNLETEERIIPHKFTLKQNYPNPFNPNTTIAYSLPKQSYIDLKIYNIKGQLVRTLYNDEQEAGEYSINWDGSDEQGRVVSSGVYFYSLQTDDFVQTRKMLLLR